ncbi:MAG: toxin-antitoxin system HicB family antitoxin [Desulfobulbaceae bacterium]|jgi:predicted HicB family RNase H-like nuclease|nr:toxin-antitoxin system HicB family antitoxin [Desulfobulbaceae bacterium]
MLDHDHYTYRVTWSEEDVEYIGLCAEFPSLSWLDQSPEDALKGIRQVVADVVKDLAADGENVPEPLASKKFSGKFQVRVTADTHRALAIKAAERNVSLNRLVSESLASSC